MAGDVATTMEEIIDHQARLDAKDSAERWRAWVRSQHVAGGAKLFKWTKMPEAWVPHSVQHGNATSAIPAHLLQAEASRLSALWQPNESGRSDARYILCHPHHLENLPFGTDDIRHISSTFSSKTSQTFDGFHVRQYSLLSHGGLECLGLILQACLAVSALPPQVSYLVAFLISKAKGGFRSLGLFPSLYRLLLRCLRPRLRAWEHEYRRPFFSFASGQSCIWLLWRQSVAAETCALAGRHCAIFLWDMSDYYEHICRETLKQRATTTNFPRDILDFICCMYGCQRLLTMGEAVVQMGRPT